jgi:serine/threonine protein kinase
MPLPSESVLSFLDLARSRRVIQPDHVDDLSRRPDLPQKNLSAVCDYLLARGVLTAFQADLVRSGRADELTFAGYPVVNELGPCPGGTAYRALHPSLRTPVILRRLRSDWFAPADNVAAAVQRVHDACPVVHPHLAHLLDAGVFRDEPFVTLDPFDGADLDTLVSDIGPMPTGLAMTYGRQLALALATAHDRGLVHGEVRPGTVHVGPLVPMSKRRADGSTRYRPAPEAIVKLFELGLVPLRPALDPWSVEVNLPADRLAFAAPERLTAGDPTRAGDVYSLGATLYFLLTGRPPFGGPDAVTLLGEMRDATPPSLAALRPDAPASLIELVESLLARDPDGRPTSAEVAARLAAVSPGPPATAPKLASSSGSIITGLAGGGTAAHPGVNGNGSTHEPPMAEPVSDVPLKAEGEDHPSGWVAVPFAGTVESDTVSFTPTAVEAWPGTGEPHAAPNAFAPPSDEALPAPRSTSPKDRSRLWWWIGVGAGLQLLALAGWAILVFQPGCPAPETSSPKPAPTPKKAPPPKPALETD